MLFSKPIPFRQALEARSVKALLPSTLVTSDWDKVSAALRERALFSSTVDDSDFLQKGHDLVDQILNGEMNMVKAKTELGDYLNDIGYRPSPEDYGSIEDLGSDVRKEVKLRTDTDMALGYGTWSEGQDPTLLDEYPCLELFRLEEREAKRPWLKIWKDAGGQTYGPDKDRMIARKDDPIWIAISRFKQPYPPFDFNSGMWTHNVGRDEAFVLGVIDADTQIEPQTRDFNEELQATPDVRNSALRTQLLEELGPDYQFDGDVLRRVQ